MLALLVASKRPERRTDKKEDKNKERQERQERQPGLDRLACPPCLPARLLRAECPSFYLYASLASLAIAKLRAKVTRLRAKVAFYKIQIKKAEAAILSFC
jgi:hypothetical protein